MRSCRPFTQRRRGKLTERRGLSREFRRVDQVPEARPLEMWRPRQPGPGRTMSDYGFKHGLLAVVGAVEFGSGIETDFADITSLGQVTLEQYHLVGMLAHQIGGCTPSVVYRRLLQLGIDCIVVAPSRTPQPKGVRQKTDRRDAMMLARLHRAGELTGIHIPDAIDESIRDLIGRESGRIY